jgi:hypothetical protein
MYSRPNIHLYFWLLRRGRKVNSYFLLTFMLGNCKQVNEENPVTVNVIRHSLLHLEVHKPDYYVGRKASGLYMFLHYRLLSLYANDLCVVAQWYYAAEPNR